MGPSGSDDAAGTGSGEVDVGGFGSAEVGDAAVAALRAAFLENARTTACSEALRLPRSQGLHDMPLCDVLSSEEGSLCCKSHHGLHGRRSSLPGGAPHLTPVVIALFLLCSTCSPDSPGRLRCLLYEVHEFLRQPHPQQAGRQGHRETNSCRQQSLLTQMSS